VRRERLQAALLRVAQRLAAPAVADAPLVPVLVVLQMPLVTFLEISLVKVEALDPKSIRAQIYATTWRSP
jgi:hypothetical protein